MIHILVAEDNASYRKSTYKGLDIRCMKQGTAQKLWMF